MITECSKEIMELIAKAGLSPPVCFGRLKTTKGDERWFLGLVSEEDMEEYLWELSKNYPVP